jgi:hypothetical protein
MSVGGKQNRSGTGLQCHLAGLSNEFAFKTQKERIHPDRMFNTEQIKKLMDAQPFKPFRICMSDGKTYDITNHDAAFVTRHYVEVGIDPNPRGISEEIDRCAIIHITRIEDLQLA